MMAARIVRSPAAEQDYRDIWRHIAADNPDAADRLLLQFDEKLALYADNPGMGQSRDEFIPQLRSFPVGNYIVFYLPVADGIRLYRVFHGARDLKSAFRT